MEMERMKEEGNADKMDNEEKQICWKENRFDFMTTRSSLQFEVFLLISPLSLHRRGSRACGQDPALCVLVQLPGHHVSKQDNNICICTGQPTF